MKNVVECYKHFFSYFNALVTNGVAFPMGRDSATFPDKGTEVPSLSRDKGSTGQAQNLAMGWDGPGQPIKIRYGTITIFLLWFPVLERPFLLCPVLSCVPSRPLARFLACPIVPLSRDNEGTSVPLSRKVALSRPVGNPSWNRLPAES